MQAVPAGCCSALRDAQAYQVRLEQQGQVYGYSAYSHFAYEKLYCCYLSGRSQKRRDGQKYPQGVSRPEPGGKDCQGFGVFRHFCHPLL